MKNTAVALALIFVALFSALARGEVIKNIERNVVVTGPNGKDNFQIIYSAHLENSQRQTGRSSSLTHPVDTRQCHWNIKTYVTRDVCLVANNGEKFCKGKLNRLFEIGKGSSGSSFNISSLQGDNCGKMRGRINGDISSARSKLIGSFDQILNDDINKVAEQIKTENKADSVTIN